MAYEILLLKRAVKDIDEICLYLSQFYPGTVGRFLDSLEKGFENLAMNPQMYAEYFGNRKYRRMVVQNYLVFYRIFDNSRCVRVYRILHGKQDVSSFIPPGNN
jgi:plasmid stabilization system protein ParE